MIRSYMYLNIIVVNKVMFIIFYMVMDIIFDYLKLVHILY
jgi:hypothetical protein